MQRQKSTMDSFPDAFEYEHNSRSNDTGMEDQIFWDNMLSPVEARLPDFLISPSEANFTLPNSVGHDGTSLSGWNLGEASSSQNTGNHDVAKMDHGWPSSLSTHAGAGPILEEGRYEPANMLSLDSVNLNHSYQVSNGSLFMQNSSSDNISNGVQAMEAGVCLPQMYRRDGSEAEKITFPAGTTNPSIATSGSRGKRKAIEGISGPSSSSGGSSSFFQRDENNLWHTDPARYNVSRNLNISTPVSTDVNPIEHLNPRHSSSSVAVNGESSQRNFRIRFNPSHQQDHTPSNMSSTANVVVHAHSSTPHQSSSGLVSFTHSSNFRPVVFNTGNVQSPSPVVHVPEVPRNMHPSQPWHGPSSTRVGSSSSSTINLRERTSAFRAEVNSRRTPRNTSEHPMFVPQADTRNLAQDPINWSLANGSMATSGDITSTSRVGSSSGAARPSIAPSLLPHDNPRQRLSEAVRRSLFASAGSEPGGRGSRNVVPIRSAISAAPQELSSGAGHQGHQHYPRSPVWMERQGDGVRGVPLSFRTLAAAGEGRSRLVSEIRNALDFMRRGGEGLRFEDVFILDQSVFYGGADLHDRHRDMRLDVDNMSYEELLALEERIGDVNTGLSEETILKRLKLRKYLSLTIGSPSDEEPCCVCQEEYVNGDDLGVLNCGHDFHADCLKQWLTHKNLCPICKTTALIT